MARRKGKEVTILPKKCIKCAHKQLLEAFDRKSELYEILLKNYVKVRDENERLRAALKYYANKDIYFISDDDAAEFDQGKKARKALSGGWIYDEQS